MKKTLLCMMLGASLALAGVAAAADAVPAKSAKVKAGAKAAPAPVAAEAAAPAVESPEAIKRRTDIEFWVSKYDGNDLRTGSNRCAAPRIPAVSKQNEEIIRVVKSYEAWQACQATYVSTLEAAAPLSKKIPPELSKQMSEAEVKQANTHLGEVHAQLLADADINAGMVKADYAAWRSATNNYIKEFKAVMKAAEAQEKSLPRDEQPTRK